jgi:hypothetical protein
LVSVPKTILRSQGTRGGVPDVNIFPTATPEDTEVSPNKGTLSVMDQFAQEVIWTGVAIIR